MPKAPAYHHLILVRTNYNLMLLILPQQELGFFQTVMDHLIKFLQQMVREFYRGQLFPVPEQ